MKTTTNTSAEYGLADIAAPFIQFKGNLAECFLKARGMGLCGIYRRTNAGWVTVAVRYWEKFTPAKLIRNKGR